MRLLTALTIVTLAFMAAAPAQESRSPAPSRQAEKSADWQSVITKQIEAFRAADAAAALSCAAESFRQLFTENPAQFYDAIANSSSYSPIVKSSSHAFGEFKMADDRKAVLQIVTITSPGRRSYKTIYEMGLEPGGWKVQMVTALIDDSVT